MKKTTVRGSSTASTQAGGIGRCHSASIVSNSNDKTVKLIIGYSTGSWSYDFSTSWTVLWVRGNHRSRAFNSIRDPLSGITYSRIDAFVSNPLDDTIEIVGAQHDRCECHRASTIILHSSVHYFFASGTDMMEMKWKLSTGYHNVFILTPFDDLIPLRSIWTVPASGKVHRRSML